MNDQILMRKFYKRNENGTQQKRNDKLNFQLNRRKKENMIFFFKRNAFAKYRKACSILRDGAPPCGPAGARSFMNSTRTMLHRNIKFSIIDIQTGATSILLYGVSFIQQLRFSHVYSMSLLLFFFPHVPFDSC